MNYTACPASHFPLVARVTYDKGYNKTYTFELCQKCKDTPVFQNNILQVEELN